MTDTWRFYVLFLSNIMFFVNFAPPASVPMGGLAGDKPKAGSVPNDMKMWVKIILPMISLYYTMCSVLAHTGPLSTLEWFSFWILVFGFAFRMWCYVELKHYFTEILGIRENHELITTGPYKYLVHPSYFGQILVVFNYLYLVDSHKLFFILVAIEYAKGCKFRMEQEETMMQEHFGDEYIAYMNERWRLFPFV